MNVAEYLLARLKSLGVDDLFGIPGDYILPFFETLAASDLRHIAPCNELNGGYAADGYARMKGLGAIAVTYGPGSFSLVNAVAGADAERVPLVVISGGPPVAAYRDQPAMHHVLPRRYDAALQIFEPVTVAARRVEDAGTAPALIDELLQQCLAERRPVYLELPRDLQLCECAQPARLPVVKMRGEGAATAAAIQVLAQRLEAAGTCVLVVGHEVQQFGLNDELIAFVEQTGVPVASVFSGKPDFIEQHPQCIGVYHGRGSLDEVRAYVEGADAVVWFGAVPSDFNLGGSTAELGPGQMIVAFDGRLSLTGHEFDGVALGDLLAGLREALPESRWSMQGAPRHGFSYTVSQDYVADHDREITNERFYARLAHFLEPGDLVFADAGPSINLAYLQMPAGARYAASGYWASIGAGFGFVLGASIALGDSRRIVAVVGDGAFQMTAQELSTLIRYRRSPIIFIINNRGYTAERLIHDGPFNDIQNWCYHRLPEVLGGEAGVEVRTEGDLERALELAGSHDSGGPLVIEVHLDPFDVPDSFERMSAGLRSR